LHAAKTKALFRVEQTGAFRASLSAGRVRSHLGGYLGGAIATIFAVIRIRQKRRSRA
jgi:hypothetical protein